MTGWAKFWQLFLTPATARFILALIALAQAGAVMWGLMTLQIDERNREPVMLAVGIVMSLASMAFGYYFGSTARGDTAAAVPPPPVEGEA